MPKPHGEHSQVASEPERPDDNVAFLEKRIEYILHNPNNNTEAVDALVPSNITADPDEFRKLWKGSLE